MSNPAGIQTPETLTQAPAHLMAQLAEVADAGSDRAGYERGVLACLRQALDFDVGFFVREDTIGDAHVGLDDALVDATRRKVAGYGRELAPVLEAALAAGLAVDREVLGPRLERTRLFREFIAPHQGHSTVLMPLMFRQRPLGLLALGRSRGGFSPGELCRLRALLPVLRVCEASRGRAQAPNPLTPRERDVLDYLCLGYGNREIAHACDTSVNTVRNQLQSIYRKLGASTRAEAVGLALRGAGD